MAFVETLGILRADGNGDIEVASDLDTVEAGRGDADHGM